MKVLDLQCAFGHVFEGWFASEADFIDQNHRSLVQCPVCGDPSVVKRLSAPRLSLSGSRSDTAERDGAGRDAANAAIKKIDPSDALMAMARRMLSETTDVGDQFAEEARKMHYGEKKPLGIRGTATSDETQALAEEGIEVLSFPMQQAIKGTLQ